MGSLPINNNIREGVIFFSFYTFNLLGPRVCSEFYPGWFVTWGQKNGYPHHSTFISNIDYMYHHWNASFSIYMIHGGTNFGFQNGEESTNGVRGVCKPKNFDLGNYFV